MIIFFGCIYYCSVWYLRLIVLTCCLSDLFYHLLFSASASLWRLEIQTLTSAALVITQRAPGKSGWWRLSGHLPPSVRQSPPLPSLFPFKFCFLSPLCLLCVFHVCCCHCMCLCVCVCVYVWLCWLVSFTIINIGSYSWICICIILCFFKSKTPLNC